MLNRKILTKDQALQKIRQYCSYQERCHSEVKEKLYSYGLRKSEVEELISNLVESNYLNEERFAIQFAGGKFRMNSWGRKKILYALQQKKVSTWCINNALKQIDEDGYDTLLMKLAKTKWANLPGENNMNRRAKTFAFLLQKGYESEKINSALSRLNQEE